VSRASRSERIGSVIVAALAAVLAPYGARARARNLLAAIVIALAPPAAAEPLVIAALGDSLTQGYGLPEEQGFVPQLEAWLAARGEAVQVLNAGVSGDTTAGGLSRIGWTLAPEVAGLIVALGGNDLLRGIDPAVSRANLDGILAAAGAAGVPVLLVGLPAPGNYGPEFKAAFEAMYPELAAEHGALFHPNFLAGLSAAAEAGTPAATLMQPDGIHPSAEGVRLIVEDLGPAVLELVRAARAARAARGM
jgi:acyl-CoA thioesterase-1